MSMNKKKWFTLIEMLIVLLIIGILLAIGFSLNWNSVDQLRTKSSVEELSSFFDTKFLQIQASNYENWQAYLGIDITLSWWATYIPYVYHLSWEDVSSNFYWETFTIMQITWTDAANWDQQYWSVTIQYVPFTPACKLIWNEILLDKVFFSARPRGLKVACFELDKDYCKLRAIRCPWDKY